jgi:Undecaprenyl-phosphate glucose phosphotransferase
MPGTIRGNNPRVLAVMVPVSAESAAEVSTSAEASSSVTHTSSASKAMQAVRRLAVRINWAPLLGPLDRAVSDKRGSISRPKLLFIISLFDAVVLVAAGLLTHAATGAPIKSALLEGTVVLLLACFSVALLRRQWAYSIAALRHFSDQVGKTLMTLPMVFAGLAGTTYLLQFDLFTPTWLVSWLALAIAGIGLTRFATQSLVRSLTASNRLTRRTLIVGGGPDAEQLIQALRADSRSELDILGVFDDRNDGRSGTAIAGVKKLGSFESLDAFCRDHGVDLLIVTVPPTAETRLMQILNQLFTLQVDIRISALNSKLRLNSRAYAHIGQVPMLAVMDKPLGDWDRAIKNVEDKVLSAILLVLAAPIMALTALAIRLDSKGPVLFKQKRFGFNNELIEVYKFRSMYTDMSDANASKLVSKGDPRVTKVGRFIRKTSLDELPQLFNVLQGNMSLVGPRPHATQAKADVDLYQTVVAGYFARHRMKPGVTGWAQVNGWRGETDTHEKILRRVEYDLAYIDRWSVMFDLAIIAMTPLSLLMNKNAY